MVICDPNMPASKRNQWKHIDAFGEVTAQTGKNVSEVLSDHCVLSNKHVQLFNNMNVGLKHRRMFLRNNVYMRAEQSCCSAQSSHLWLWLHPAEEEEKPSETNQVHFLMLDAGELSVYCCALSRTILTIASRYGQVRRRIVHLLCRDMASSGSCKLLGRILARLAAYDGKFWTSVS